MRSKLPLRKFVMLLLLTLSIWQISAAQFKVVGYAVSWNPTTIQYSKLTHINYSFALPQYGGRLKPIANPGYLQSIVSNAHANGVKVYIAIGGWSDNGSVLDPVFESIGADPGSRANLINDAIYLINTYNLDGVDMDWEYPNPGSSATNFTTLMREMSNALRARGKGLSFASPADAYSASGIESAVFQYVDHVNIMAYDGGGAHHSTYQFAVDGLNLFKGKGCPASKCVVGVPFYARPSWRSYSQLLAAGASPNSDWFGSDGYNGIPTIKQKTQMALNQAGGIMIWELAMDVQGSNSLLSAIHEVVKANNNNNDNGVTNLGGTYRLQNRHSGLYMDVAGNSSNDGANIHQWSGNTCLCQQFTFTHLGNGVYKIIAKNSGKSLDVANFSTSDGANILQWPYHGGTNQQFIVQSAGDGFYKLRAKNSGKAVEVGGWSTSPGGNVQQWGDGGQRSAHWKLVPVTTNSTSITIQAESYSAMSGVQREATSDAGGGENVGYIDTGDWMAYNSINFPTTGSYLVEYRVASMGGGRLSLDLNAGSIQLGAVNVPATGGWQNWRTVSHTVNVNAGTYNVGIFAQTGGWNINWIRISRSGTAAARTVQLNSSTDDFFETTFEFYPNPADDALYIKSVMDLTGGQAKIYDGLGIEVISTIVEAETVNVASLKSGIYTLVITKDGNKVSRRFIKQ